MSAQVEPALPQQHAEPSPQPAADWAAGWRLALPLLLGLLGLTLWLYRRTAADMAGIWWRSDTFAHAMLVPPLVLWLLWGERERLKRLAPQPWLGAVPGVALCALLWWAGDLLQSNVLTQFALVALLVSVVLVLLGQRIARTVWFPLAFAFFAVPAGEALVPPLMEGTADFTVAALRLSGIPVYREGMSFVIPSGHWSVVEACSGVRYLIASFMVGTLFAFQVYQSTSRRLAFMVVSLLVPVLANWVRAYLIVLVGHLSSNQLATGVDHLVYGWVFFGVVMLLTYWVGARWSEAAAPAATTPTALTGAATPPAPARQALATVLVLGALAWPVLPQQAGPQVQPGPLELVLPAALPNPWRSPVAAAQTWGPVHVRPNGHAAAVYGAGPQAVGVDAAYYRRQDRERKLVSSTHLLVPQGHALWQPRAVGAVAVPWQGRKLSLRASRLVNLPGNRPDKLVWQVYWVNGQFTADDMQARLQQGLSLLRGRGDDGALLTLYTDIDEPQAAAQRLQAFAQVALPALQDALVAARARAQAP